MPTIKFQRPQFTADAAMAIAAELYGIQSSIQPLPSERDQNFYLRTSESEEFVLKIANEDEDRALLESQNEAMAHLAAVDGSVLVSRVCSTRAGDSISTVRDAGGKQHMVRLLTYIPAQLLANIKPQSPRLLESLGRVLGSIDKGLEGFEHPAVHRELKWDLKHASWIREYLIHIESPSRRATVEKLISLYENLAKPLFPRLRQSVIYNDANDYNVLVRGEHPHDLSVVGVIDFGDMVHTFTVCDLAVAAPYAMFDKNDPLAAACNIVRGYHQVYPLAESEIEALYPLICARVCITVTNAAYQRKVAPENEYLTISEQPAWELLEKLAAVHPRLAHYMFRRACGLVACPSSAGLTRWLQANRVNIGRVVEPELNSDTAVVLDLSIGSAQIGSAADFDDVERFTRTLFDRMHDCGVEVGIGRYNEARPIYTSDLFKVEGNDGPEWRTIHIGLDLFMKAGSPVFAPLAGTLHSFHNNDGLLDYGPTIILQHSVQGGEVTFFTLYGHLSEDSLEGLYRGMAIERGARIAKVGDYPVNGNWPPHLHFQLIADLLDKEGDFPGVALPGQRDLWLSISPDPNLILGIPEDLVAIKGLTAAEILEARKNRIGPSLSLSYAEPLHIVRGFMQYLYDEDGRKYLDCVNNVAHVGHCHPRVVQAAAEQMTVLNTNTRYLHDNIVRYAGRLCATLPEPLRVCFFVNSGSEANELALRMARAYTGGGDFIVLDHAYHGNTTTLIDLSPYKCEAPGGSGLASNVHKAMLPDTYRGKFRAGDPDAGAKYAQHVRELVKTSGTKNGKLAAFICESLPSCAGQIILPEDYLRESYRYVRDGGGLCIADEVQVGFGRVGSHFWAFERQGVVPDIVTMGKPIGNGHPLGAVTTTSAIAESFAGGMEYFNTFGGNPVSCAVGTAVLDVIEDEGLQARARSVGDYLMSGLRALAGKHELIGDVRGSGLFIGVELVSNRETLKPATDEAEYLINRMKELGVLLSTDGPFHNVLKIKPPMMFSESDADLLVRTLDQVLEEIAC